MQPWSVHSVNCLQLVARCIDPALCSRPTLCHPPAAGNRRTHPHHNLSIMPSFPWELNKKQTIKPAMNDIIWAILQRCSNGMLTCLHFGVQVFVSCPITMFLLRFAYQVRCHYTNTYFIWKDKTSVKRSKTRELLSWHRSCQKRKNVEESRLSWMQFSVCRMKIALKIIIYMT